MKILAFILGILVSMPLFSKNLTPGDDKNFAKLYADAEYHVHGFELAFDCVRALDPSYPSSGEEQRARPTMTTVVKDHIAIGPRPSQTYQIANTQLRGAKRRSNPENVGRPYVLWIASLCSQ